MTEQDGQFLRRAIALAMGGRGLTEPNPSVGCVLVKAGRVIGEGRTQFFGGAHAEPTALANCSEDPARATAFVSLEPCCHTNKRTPPCVPRLIAAKITRVVVGCLDPNPDVNGKGIAMLREAGIAVDRASSEIEAEAKQLIAPFIARIVHHRPYVTLKWAQSSNGKVAGAMGKRVKITNETSDRIVHQLRARCDAIAVGTNTVLADDPLLTARALDGRDVESPRKLLRVILSNTLKIPLGSKLVKSARENPLIVYCSESSAKGNPHSVAALEEVGVEVVALADHESHFSFQEVLRHLHSRGVTHLLVEPGPTLTRYFFSRGQADRVWVFSSPNSIYDETAPSAPRVEYPCTGELELNGDVLREYLNPSSEVFFSGVESADLVLSRAQACR